MPLTDYRTTGLVSEMHKQYLDSYTESCRILNLDPEKPKVFEDLSFALKPHQVTGIVAGYYKERDAFPFHVLADDCGLGKTCQMLHIIWFINQHMESKGSEDFRPTVILAP